MANLFYVSCSFDDDFFYDSSEPYSEIALSKEYTNYCLLNHEINILINELDKADSIQEEKLKDQLNEMLIDYKYSKEVLFSKYTIIESFDVLQKEELYQYAISINSNLKALNKKRVIQESTLVVAMIIQKQLRKFIKMQIGQKRAIQ